MAPIVVHEWERFLIEQEQATSRDVGVKSFLLVVFFCHAAALTPLVHVHHVFGPMQQQPGLPGATGLFAKVRLLAAECGR